MSGYDVAVGRLPQKVELLLAATALLPLLILCPFPVGATAESHSTDLDFLVHKHCFLSVLKGDAKEGC